MVNYLTFTSVGTTSTVYLQNTSNSPNCQYSADGGTTWNTMPTASGSAVSISAGQSILVRGTNSSGFSRSAAVYSTFKMTGSISASGSVMSLIDGVGETTTIPVDYCHCRMFYGCTSLTTAPSLTATTLHTYCYYCMFYGCTSLTTPPALPATTLQKGCYYSMFRGCTSLTTAPSLPATTLQSYCYEGMFYGCTALTTAPQLPATTLQSYCYDSMFYGCTSLTTPPALPATTLQISCYDGMFRGCTSLKVANAPASGYTHFFTCPSSLPKSAISNMFSGTGGSYTSNPVANGAYYFEGSYPTTSSIIHANVNGTWKDTTPYVNVNGTWKEATPYVNVNGTWKESN